MQLKTLKLKTPGIQKFLTLQIYAYVCQKTMNFLRIKFHHQTLTRNDFFETVHKITNVKIVLHHSQVTGKITGYANDFCNMKVKENQTSFTCLARQFFLNLTCITCLKELGFCFETQKIFKLEEID